MKNSNYIFFILLVVISIGCNKKNPPKNTEIKRNENHLNSEHSIIKSINDTLSKKIDLTKFMDSITKQSNVKIVELINSEWNEKNNIYKYKGKNYNYTLKIVGQEKGINTNSIFMDGKNTFSFKNYKVLGYNDTYFESENYGFNFQNSLENIKLIKIAHKTFLYADITFMCNGIGCGCQLNFIYDIERKKPFFIDNYRFPFNKFFLSDFNNDSVIDLAIVSRGKERTSKELGVEKNTYRVSWFEYKDGNFVEKKNGIKKEKHFLEFISYTLSFNHGESENCQYAILKNNWN